MAENTPPGKGQQAGRSGALQPESKAAAHGISEQRRGADFQQPGRKNWLFCDTTKGAEASAIVYSLVESAKANGVEPFAYLQHVLVELPYLGKNQSHEELESFMPWAPYIQQEFGVKNSDAYVNTYLD